MSRHPLTSVRGVAMPLMLTNVDTDVIIRVERMTTSDVDVLGPFAFESLRYLPDGAENAAFVGNDVRFRGAPILLAGHNFGCGSSREPAVLALIGFGIRCVIAPSFGDIFFGNCHQNGVLPITLADIDVHALAQLAATGATFVVDLDPQTIVVGDERWTFAIGALQKRALLQGLDDLDLTLLEADAIVEWQARDRELRPWVWHQAAADERRLNQ